MSHLSFERQVALRGSAAAEWLADHGWQTRGDCRSLVLFADSIRVHGYSLRRVWHSGQQLTRLPQPSSIRTLSGLLLVEGAFAVSSNGQALDCQVGQTIVTCDAPERAPVLQVETAGPTAFIEVSRELPSLPIGAPGSPLISRIDAPYFTLLARLAIEVLSSELTVFDLGTSHLMSAVESMLWALIAHEQRSVAPQESGYAASVYQRGLDAIGELFADAATDLPAISHKAGVSAAHLQRSFREMRTTPHDELQRARARHALHLLNTPGNATHDREDIARMAGFNSASVMRRVIKRMQESELRSA